MGSSPGGGGRRDRSTGSPRLRASKTASKLWEKEDQGRRLQLGARTPWGASTTCHMADDSSLYPFLCSIFKKFLFLAVL